MISNYLEILEVNSVDELRMKLVKSAEELEFKYVNALLVVDRAGGDSIFFDVSNAPLGWLKSGGSDPTAYRRDPVMQHCKRSSLPIVWDQSTYATAGEAGLWEDQAAYGYRAGICTALHLPNGLHFALGVDRDADLPATSERISEIAGRLQLLAACAHEVTCRLYNEVLQKEHNLTFRELEVLRWIKEGKTCWEAGRILNITERTVAKHLQSACRKMDASNGHHAALIAWRNGYIH